MSAESTRPIRLWYQSFAPTPHFGGYPEALQSTLLRAADPTTEIQVVGLERLGREVDLESRAVELRGTKEVIDNALAAEASGYDAFLIGNIADPGLSETRQLLAIPVLGLCETALHLACLMGRRFGLVTVSGVFTRRALENVARYGLEAQLAAHEPIVVDRLPALGEAFDDAAKGEELEAAFRDAARRCIARGAEVIIAASGVVAIFLTTRGIHEIDGAPILDGAVALLKMGETAVKLQRLGIPFTSSAAGSAMPSR